jgi:prepilin-type N-terminal cleavage/methylation domain-containing protein
MLSRIRKAMDEKDQGFTLIELLVVMIIIGILAAIAIPVFLSQRAKAQDSATKADVSTIGKELATFYVDSNSAGTVSNVSGKYVFTPAAGTAVTMGNASANVTVLAGAATNIVSDSAWCIGLTNAKGDKKNWKYSASAGLSQGTCSGTS